MKYLWTTLYVKNLDESIAFYRDLVGLDLLKRFPAGAGVEIAFMGNGIDPETTVELLADGKSGELAAGESVALGFAVDSLESMLDTVKSRSIPVCLGPLETPASKFFGIKDPNGFNIQFFQQK